MHKIEPGKNILRRTESGIPRLLIIGGGFAGLNAAKALTGAKLDIILIDRTNHHLFQPLLYQVASASLSPGDIAVPIRAILKKQKNVRVYMAEVAGIHADQNKVRFVSGEEMDYDFCIVATGARHSYFAHPEWEQFAPGLKTIADALRIREKLLLSFEEAEVIEDPDLRREYLTFVVVGGGPTGVEMAGAIAEIARNTMTEDFRNIDPRSTRIFLVENHDRLLPPYSQSLSAYAKRALEKKGVDVLTSAMVKTITENGVMVAGREGTERYIETRNVIWAAGNNASPLISSLPGEKDRAGRIIVNKDLSVPGYKNLFVIGDSAAFSVKDHFLPGIAPVAIQQGKFVARLLRGEISGRSRKEFQYLDKGTMATIGRAAAVAQVRGLEFTGLPAWLAWIFIHILYLIGFRNRMVVFSEWVWNYMSFQRAARLITTLKSRH